MNAPLYGNPFRPGAGHAPPYLAGRHEETREFTRLLDQRIILENAVLTGLRGVGKTVLLETFKPLAISKGWRWVGADLSESASVSETTMSMRILTDLAIVTSTIVYQAGEEPKIGFVPQTEFVEHRLTYQVLSEVFKGTPGLVSDKLKNVLEFVWKWLSQSNDQAKGLVFAYDEAQTMSDQSTADQYPLSVLLDVFQSIQRKEIPFLLVLTGLPTLFPKLVEARTYAERMFRVIFLDRLNEQESRAAILKPIETANCPISFNAQSVDRIVELSSGYPYFIQFICREIYDLWIQKMNAGQDPTVPVEEILRKLDTDFFAGRWSRATDRQRQLLQVIALLENCEEEFTVQEIVELSKSTSGKPFGNSHVNQMLSTLSNAGLIFKNRHGKYSFAVPLLGGFIKRQLEELRA